MANENTRPVELNKVYRTEDGRPARILCIDYKNLAIPGLCVVGLITLPSDREAIGIWTALGKSNEDSRMNLVEVQPWEAYEDDEPVLFKLNTDVWQRGHFAKVNGTLPAVYVKNGSKWVSCSTWCYVDKCIRPNELECAE